MTDTSSYTLYHASGMSSTYVIALLEIFKLPYKLKTIDLDFTPDGIVFESEEDADLFRELKAVNPKAQFPTLVVSSYGDEFVLSEMVAIAFYLHDKYSTGTSWSTTEFKNSQRALYYRLMAFIPANIYPPITMLDFPSRFVDVPKSALVAANEMELWVKNKATETRKEAFSALESLMQPSLDTHFAIGSAHPTLLDIFIATVSHFAPQPRSQWLQENCPRVYACCREVLKDPILQKIFRAQNFDCHLAEAI